MHVSFPLQAKWTVTKLHLYTQSYTCPFTQVILKMNRPTYNFTGVIFYWGICTFTQVLDLWATA